MPKSKNNSPIDIEEIQYRNCKDDNPNTQRNKS